MRHGGQSGKDACKKEWNVASVGHVLLKIEGATRVQPSFITARSAASQCSTATGSGTASDRTITPAKPLRTKYSTNIRSITVSYRPLFMWPWMSISPGQTRKRRSMVSPSAIRESREARSSAQTRRNQSFIKAPKMVLFRTM